MEIISFKINRISFDKLMLCQTKVRPNAIIEISNLLNNYLKSENRCLVKSFNIPYEIQ